ncbi:MAG: peroxidase family protein [Paracoccaceae bacterium]
MASLPHGMTRMDMFHKSHCEPEKHLSPVFSQHFGRMFHKDGNDLQWTGDKNDLVQHFMDLVAGMERKETQTGKADAGMTFFGQFIDHDVTLDVTSAIGTRIDPRAIRNVRTPNLDLDCVYGDGPEASPHLYAEMRVGEKKHGEFLAFGQSKNPHDLARTTHGVALIGDPRNDENAFLSQLQGSFITLHNILMAEHHRGGEMAADIRSCAHQGLGELNWNDVVIPRFAGFEEVRRFIRLHYQYLVLKDFLPQFVTREAIDAAWAKAVPLGSPVMPVEFSAAGFRFGHATVQPEYQIKTDGTCIDLFPAMGFGPKGKDVNIETMSLFFGPDAQRARPVGTGVASPLFELPFITAPIQFEDHPGVAVKHPASANLALRNILRDRFALSVASGQQMARKFGVDQLPPPQALAKHGIEKTPLWFYCLEEADASSHGQLDGVGGRIVAGVLINLLRRDPTSVLHMWNNFTPYEGFGGENITMASLLDWVEKHKGSLDHPEDLFAG